MDVHCSLTVLALILLYGGYCSSVRLQSKGTFRLPTSHNNAPQQMAMFLGIIMEFVCALQQGIDRAGLGASRNGEC